MKWHVMSTMQEFERNICVTPAAMFCYQYYCLIISELQPYRPDTLADIKLAVHKMVKGEHTKWVG